MPWFKLSDSEPTEGERVLIHEGGTNRMLTGLYTGGRWYAEDSGGVGLTEVSGVTHWAPLLDSEEYDPADD